MLDPDLADDQREKIAADARSRIESGGSLKHDESWGTRKLAYDIKQRTEADYRFYRFAGERPLLDALDHNLKITDGVLRFRIFRVDPRAPLITPPDPSSVAARAPRRGERRDDAGAADSEAAADEGVEVAAATAEPDAAVEPAPGAAEPVAEPAEASPAPEDAA